MLFKLFIIHLLIKSGICSKNILNIASIFEEPHLEETFRNVISEINSQADINFKLNLLRTTITPDDPFYALTEVCQHLESGVVGVFGPTSSSNVDIVQSVCDAKEIPHILTHWTEPLKLGSQINFFPNPKLLTDAYIDIISNFGWEEVTMLYVNPKSLLKLSDFIEKGTNNGVTVYIENLDPHRTGNYRPVLRKLRDSEQHNFVLDQMEDLDRVLLQMQQIGMLVDEYNYFLTDFNVDNIILEPFSHGRAKFIGIQLLNPEVNAQQRYPEIYKGFNEDTLILGSEAGLIIDSLNMFTNTLKVLNIDEGSHNLSCNNSNTWRNGYSVVNLLRSSTYTGITGQIEFDSDGYRNVFELTIFEIHEGDVRTKGSWHSSTRLNITQAGEEFEEGVTGEGNLSNRQLVVVIVLTEPYAMKKWDCLKTYFGNDCYEGLAIDLINELASITGFNYTFAVREDNNLGQVDSVTGKWTGIIGDIIEERADLAIADLTITSEREEAVDFTPPFMTLGISILYQIHSKTPGFFSFADPFASEVWILILVACVWVAISTLVLGRISSKEWTNPHPCKKEPEYVVNELSLANCLWFVVGCGTQQGSEIKLRSIATRIIAAVWWFFTFFMISLYIANQAAMLTRKDVDTDFSNFHELVENAEKMGITYGAKIGGATANFFMEQAKNQPYSDFAKAWEFMQNHEEAMVAVNKEGVEKVENGGYAFFMESSSLKYESRRSCNLQQVGDLLNSKGYGIAMSKNSPYRGILSTALLKLINEGTVDKMIDKWWNEGRSVELCALDQVSPLTMENLQGVFWLTFSGILLAFFVAVTQAIMYILRKARRTKSPFRKVLRKEFKFYFLSGRMKKPANYENFLENKRYEEKELGRLQN